MDEHEFVRKKKRIEGITILDEFWMCFFKSIHSWLIWSFEYYGIHQPESHEIQTETNWRDKRVCYKPMRCFLGASWVSIWYFIFILSPHFLASVNIIFYLRFRIKYANFYFDKIESNI